MKRVGIFLSLGIFLLLIARYFFENFPPYNIVQLQHLVEANNIQPGDWESLNDAIDVLIEKNQILNYLSNNAYIAAGILLAAIFSLFVAVHLVIDKFFFKNFYEKASLFDAVRRGFLVCVALGLTIYLKLYGIEIQTIIFVDIFILAIEILFFVYVKQHLKLGVGKVIEFNRKVVDEVKKDNAK